MDHLQRALVHQLLCPLLVISHCDTGCFCLRDDSIRDFTEELDILQGILISDALLGDVLPLDQLQSPMNHHFVSFTHILLPESKEPYHTESFSFLPI
ncbi:hypothetical protein AMELA_G00184800 [Ameiurus melas]|uniref:Secreted protein n=1 Tax=Ameiurus melas TaxID=219545 RepID=A0A7J6A7E3_AMEME|nr:hypothetical protein AMELA_G00184800 [Ameiurus melas]